MIAKNVQDNDQSAPVKPLTDEHPFGKMVFPKFNAVAVANELLRSSSPYRGKQEVLFAGFCTWVLVPECNDLRNYTMQLSARKIIDEAFDELIENQGEPASPYRRNWKKKDIRIFKRRVYDRLGGHTATYQAISSIDIADDIEKHAVGSDIVVRLAEIWYYVIASCLVTEKDEISIVQSKHLPITVGVVDDCGKLIEYSERSVERALEMLKTSMAFSYAASTIRIPEKGTILDQMREHDLYLESPRPFIRQWFARAKYFDQTVLSRLAKPKKKPARVPHTPASRIDFGRFPSLTNIKVDVEAIPTPQFDDRQLAEIEAAYPRSLAGPRSKAQ